MSVVVGLEVKGGVWLASDSALSDNSEACEITGKIFIANDIGFGVVGNMRHAQIIENFIKVRPPAKNVNAVNWAVKELIPDIRDIFDEHKVWEWTSKSERGILVMAAVNGRVITIQEDWAVYRSGHGYAAIGSGSPFAYGSLYTSSKSKNFEKRVVDACSSAIKHHPFCLDPVYTLFVES